MPTTPSGERGERGSPRRRLLVLALAAAVLGAPGCAVLRRDRVADDRLASFGADASLATRNAIESEVMDFSDQFIMRVAQSMDELRNRVGTPEARVAAQAWKVSHSNAAVIIATNPSSFVALLDLVVLVSLGRRVVEKDWVGRFGDAAKPVADMYRDLEDDIWTLAREYLKPNQEKELRALIEDWNASNPDQRYVALVRFRDFARLRRDVPAQKERRFDSLFDLFYLDPLSNLDPAVKELTQARSTVNRVLYQLHRTPGLLSWQAELLVYRLLRTPEVQGITADLGRVTETMESATEIVKHLPGQIATERQELVRALEEQGPALHGLLGELKLTLREGEGLASSVAAAAQAIRELVPQRDEPCVEPAAEPSHPFDVREYGAAARDISGAADRLGLAIESLDRLIASPAWDERAGDIRESLADARAEGNRLLQGLFLVGLAWILVLGVVAAAIVIASARLLPSRQAVARRKVAA